MAARLKTERLIQSGNGQAAAIDRDNDIWECRGIGNSYVIVTPAGNVMVNTGTLADAKRNAPLFAAVSQQPIERIVLTQSHANQYGGLEVFKTDSNLVMAHRLYRQERLQHAMLFDHYGRGSRRIFTGITGNSADLLPTREIEPDIWVEDTVCSFELGGRRFEVIWTPGGETRSAVIVWLPEARVAIVGNLFGPLFGNHPNLNTLRGDKPRSALEFIESVKTLRQLNPVQVLTGHEDIRGEDHIRQQTTKIIDAVQWVHDRTIEGMNAGKSINQLMQEIVPPPELTLTEEYGKVSWNVRAIYHEYSGWFDPARGTTELYAVPAAAIGPAIAELAGGAELLAQRAEEMVSEGQALEALHMVDLALAADADCQRAKAAKKSALLCLERQTGGTNLWERKWIASEIERLEHSDPAP